MLRFSISATIMLVFSVIACKKEDKLGNGEDCLVKTGFNNGRVIDSQYIVFFKEQPQSQKISAAAAREADPNNLFQRLHIIPERQLAQFTGSARSYLVKLEKNGVEALRNDPAVLAVEPDRIFALSTCFQVVAPTLVTWSAKRVGYGDGRGKTAWVVDTGIDFEHPDLNVDVNRSRSFISGSATADDDNGHGTHVAGIIGAKNNNAGILGIASEASLVAVKVLDKNGEGKLSTVIEALNYIASVAKAGEVVNLSLGEEGVSDYLDQLVTRMANRGILFSIAAGNDKKPAKDFSPARVNTPNVFTVSAVDSLDAFASFSNFGNEAVDFAAPGVRIVSCYTDGRYARLSGTSMAAPHVAGLLLLNGNKIGTNGFAPNDPDGTADPIAHK